MSIPAFNCSAPFKTSESNSMSPSESCSLIERVKATPDTVKVFTPNERGCALAWNQFPLATVLTTR